MAIFPNIEVEGVLQVNDKTRLNATKSFVSKDEAAITLVEIEPEAGSGFLDVTGTSFRDYYLDWSFSGTTRTVTVSVRVTTDGVPVTTTADIEILSAADDKLFSVDSDITPFESDVLKYVEQGRNSFLNKHRAVQESILDLLNDEGITNTDGTRITKDAIVDVDEVKSWSKYWTLGLIFDDFQNSEGDKFLAKANKYLKRAARSRDKAFLRLDLDGSGTVTDNEFIDTQTKDLVRS